jgi:hypothetical protein
MGVTLAKEITAMAISDDQAAVGGDAVLRKILGDGKEKDIAKRTIVLPLVVRLEVGKAGFDLDNRNQTLGIHRHDVGSPPIGKGDLPQGHPAQISHQTHDAARQVLS